MSSSSLIIVAIDGGAASGKSSTSRALSERFNLLHVDTGSYYRALTAELLRSAISPEDPQAVARSLAQMALSTVIDGRSARMCIGGKPVDDAEIRSAAVNAHVSKFAAIPEVRAALLHYQRNQAKVAALNHFPGMVMEGRDIGSVIFPDADFRFFLHADQEERARRREREGQTDSIAERDRMDSQRKTAPLARPDGAQAIDSTNLNLEEVVDLLSALLSPKLKRLQA